MAREHQNIFSDMKVVSGPKIKLPTKHGLFDVQHVCVYQEEDDVFREGVVLQKENKGETVLVRLQSSCLFSETFWATDCDCALQLQSSLEHISEKGGTLLYFYEEGRGAGLEAKFKAISLQQIQGLDTRKAYECLNMNVDQRSYAAAAAVLLKLHNNTPICLLTNNPEKIKRLREHGVNVSESASLICGWEQPEIRRYLEDKATVLGHIVPTEKDVNK